MPELFNQPLNQPLAINRFSSRPPSRSFPALKFQGYQVATEADGSLTSAVRFFQPGFDEAQKVSVEVGGPSGATQTVELAKKTDANGTPLWQTVTSVPLNATDGLYYRFHVTGNDGKTHELLDLVWQKARPEGQFNFIPATEITKARKLGPIADVYQQSLLAANHARALEASTDPYQKYRNHYNSFYNNNPNVAATGTVPTIHQAIAENMPKLRALGFKNLLFKPFIGGDFHHNGYWTVDPYALNNTFFNKAQYRQFLKQTLQNDMKVYCDGAFVNQGLAGVQLTSNMLYGPQSPYWSWFRFDKTPSPLNWLPGVAMYDKLKLGVLPVKINPKTGLKGQPNYAAMAVRITNPPVGTNKNGAKQPYIEYYDPRLENVDGSVKPYGPERGDWNEPLLYAYQSMQKLRFPVPAEALKKKLNALQAQGISAVESNGKWVLAPKTSAEGQTANWAKTASLMSSFPGFELVPPGEDNSGYKWDGQIDVAKIQLKDNPEVLRYVGDAMSFWTRQTRNHMVGIIGSALSEAAAANPALKTNPTQWIEAITLPVNGNATKPYQVLAAPDPQYGFEAPEVIAERFNTFKNLQALAPVGKRAIGKHLAKSGLKEYPIGAVPLQDGAYPIAFKGTLQNPKLQNLLQAPGWFGWPFMVLRNSLSLLSGSDIYPFGSFEGILAGKLQRATKTLTQAEKEALQNPLVQSVVMGQLQETLYLNLLTGKSPKNTPAEVLEGLYATLPTHILNSDPVAGAPLLKGFLKNQLVQLDSQAELAPMLKQALSTQTGGGQAKASQPAITPMGAAEAMLAAAIMDNREYGLNWRLDAAKDVGDMDAVRDRQGRGVVEEFLKQNEQVLGAWDTLLNGNPAKGVEGVKPIYNKSVILSEFTDLDSGVFDSIGKDFFGNIASLFDAMPNFRFGYNRLASWVHLLRRAGEADGPGDFNAARVHSDMYMMAETLPWNVVRSMQNMGDTHDAESLPHVFLMNSAIHQADHVQQRGLKIPVVEALTEMASKTALAHDVALLQEVQVINPKETLLTWADRLKQVDETELAQWMQAADTPDDLKPELHRLLNGGHPETRPMDLRVALMEAAFNPVNGLMGNLNLSNEASAVGKQVYQQLKANYLMPIAYGIANPNAVLQDRLRDSGFWQQVNAQLTQAGVAAEYPKVRQWLTTQALLTARAIEPSEFKAARAVLSNAVLSDKIDWDSIPEDTARTKTAFFRSIDKLNAANGRHAGMQNLQRILDQICDDPRFLANYLGQPPHQVAATAAELKRQVYSVAMAPVLPKLVATFGMMAAVPGQPSVHVVNDLAAQAGSEHLKNKFVQNRPFFPAHWLTDVPEYLETADKSKLPPYFTPRYARQFMEYQTQLAEIFNLRQRFPALNDGVMLRLFDFDGHNSGNGPQSDFLNQEDVLIMPRSNGKQTVIALVNSLSTHKTSWYDDYTRMGEGANYQDNPINQPIKRNFSLDVRKLGISDGATFVTYKDNNPALGVAKRFTVQGGKLSGIDIANVKVLERIG